MVGIVAAAGLATAVVVVAHPFGHGNLAAANPVTTSHFTPAAPVASAASSGSAPAAPSVASPSPTASAITRQRAATELAGLLSRSENERQAVITAFSDTIQCGPTLSQDAQTFQAAAASHRQLLSELAQLPGISVLPAAMRQDLNAAWQASASVDSDYAQWAQDQATNGCTGSQTDSNYLAADAPNRQATKSKTAFVRWWNPLAREYGVPTYSQNDL